MFVITDLQRLVNSAAGRSWSSSEPNFRFQAAVLSTYIHQVVTQTKICHTADMLFYILQKYYLSEF